MSNLIPAAFYGLKVGPGEIEQAHDPELQGPASIRITMAAIDPSAVPKHDESLGNAPPRATLKIHRLPYNDDDDDDDDDDDEDISDDDIEAIRRRLGDALSDEDESSEDDEEKNGGPSDPSKSKKARRAQALLDALNTDDDKDMEDVDETPNGVNGAKLNKGKAKATDEDESDDDSDEEAEIFVICTLDPEKHYQQPLDIVIPEDEQVFFSVHGTHAVYLTGNYVIPADQIRADDYDEDDEYVTDEDEEETSDEDDELDGLADPRIIEMDTDEEEEEAPKLIKAEKKGSKKRPADSDDEAETLDGLISKSIKPAQAANHGEQKLSKKQAKKLKNNAGEAIPAEAAPAKKETKENKHSKEKESSGTPKSDKKVQFAKNLEQGPTPSPKVEAKKDDKPKASLGVKMVQGVKVDDKKLGSGPACKKGQKVGLRYIGKLEKDGKVFDSNKKGKPFQFTLGSGEVIKGWDIGVAGMSIGGERRITIPASLGYGGRGAPPAIPSNANLVFDLKLMSIN